MKTQRTRLAAYALILDGQRVLLCRLSAQVPSWVGWWTLPGGGVEFGEAPEQAMIREVEEETGLRVVAEGVLGVDSVVDRGEVEDRHAVRIMYRARLVGGTLRHEIGGSTDRCEWHPLHAVASLPVVDGVKAALRFHQDSAGATRPDPHAPLTP